MTKKTMIPLAVVLIALNFILPQNAMGIGQMTKPIVIKDALRGQALESTLVLYNSDEQEIVYKLVADGKIKSWTSFYSIKSSDESITEIKVPAKSNINALAKFIVPMDAPNGEYAGEVAIVTEPGSNADKGVNVAVGMRIGRQVSITVTDKEVTKFDVSIIPNKYDLGKNEPLSIRVIYDNQGNTSITPQIQLKIKSIEGSEGNSNRTVYNSIYPYPEGVQSVKPGSKYEIPAIEIPTSNLPKNRYEAEINITQGTVSLDKKFMFTVEMVDELTAQVIADLSRTDLAGTEVKGNITINWIMVAIASIGILFLVNTYLKNRQTVASAAIASKKRSGLVRRNVAGGAEGVDDENS